MTSTADQLRSIEEALRTRYWHWNIFEAPSQGATLRSFLLKNLPHIPENSWEDRWEFGGIYINGLRRPLNTSLSYPCKIEYYEPKFNFYEADKIFPSFESRFVLYQDSGIAILYKPSGLSSMPAKEQHHFSLKSSAEKELKTTIHMPSRLDVSAQGLVIVSTSKQSHAKLQQIFEQRVITKQYLCASHATPNWRERRVTLRIKRDQRHPVLRTTSTVEGQSAETHFAVLSIGNSEDKAPSILRAQPVTGRTHQIRVHAASTGLPLLGDRFYCGQPASHLHLVSHHLSCSHPITGELISFTLPASLLPEWASQISTFEPSQ